MLRGTYLLDLWELNIFGGGGIGLLRGSLSADEMYRSLSCISSRRRFTHSCFVSSEGACNERDTTMKGPVTRGTVQ